MANIGRDVGGISPTQFIRPAVEDNSGSAMLAAIGGGALKIDQAVAESQLRDELTKMNELYETSNVAITGIQPQDAATLNPSDVREINQETDRIKAMQDAIAQGRLTRDMFRMRAEASLRAAIARRPGLAQEFRQLAATTLGEDVTGATKDVLAQAEVRMYQGLKAGAEAEAEATQAANESRGKAVQEWIAPLSSVEVGQLGGDMMNIFTMSPEQLGERYSPENLATIPARALEWNLIMSARDLQATEARAKLLASVTTNTMTAQAPTQQAAFTVQQQRRQLELNAAAVAVNQLSVDGFGPDDIETARTIVDQLKRSELDYQQTINTQRGILPDPFVNTEIDISKGRIAMADAMLSDPGDDAEAFIKRTQSMFAVTALNNPTVRAMGALRNIIGDSGVAKVLDNPDLAARLGTALDSAVRRGLPREALVASSTEDLNSILGVFAKYGPNDPIPAGLRNSTLDSLLTTLDAFATVDGGSYDFSKWASPTGVAQRLANEQAFGKTIKDMYSPEERRQLVDAMLRANLRNMQSLRQWMESGQDKELAAKLTFRPTQVDGKYFFLNAKPGAELSPRELSRVEELERNFSGLNYVMRSVKNLLDIDDAQARDLLFNTPGVRRQEQVPATNAQVRDVKLRFTDEQRAEWEKLPEDLRNKILEGVRQEVSTGQEFRVTTGQPAQPAGR